MTDFIRIAATAPIQQRATYRIVAADHENFLLGIPDHFRFSDAFNAWYAQMYAKTQAVYPVSPNPAHSISSVASYDTDSPVYVVDVMVADNALPIPAVELVRRLESITNRVRVNQFVAIDEQDASDPTSRDDLQQQVAQTLSLNNPLASLGHWATLAVIGLVALAAIQISKDL